MISSMIKRCHRCSTEKPLDAFHKNKASKDGLQTCCKLCSKELNDGYYKNNPERQKNYYHKNSDKIKKYQIEYRNGNREAYKKLNAARYASVKGRSMQLFVAARNRAKKLSLEFSIDLIRIEFALFMGKCERTGLEFDLAPHANYNTNPLAPSVDRINPFKGYTPDNVRIVCVAYNLGKNQMSHEQYVAFCKSVVEFDK